MTARSQHRVEAMPQAPRVIFVTNVFGQVVNGPAAYAQYLWRHLGDHPGFELHVVAPDAPAGRARLHAPTGRGGQGAAAVRRLALELAQTGGGRALVHGNAAHSLVGLAGRVPLLIAQVNDYDAATVWRRAPAYLRQEGARRVAALMLRHVNERRVLRRATQVVCNSDYTLAAVQRAYGLPADRCRRIYKAADCHQLARREPLPADPTPGLPRGGRLIFVGSNWRRKGLATLLAAVARLRARHPMLRLTVIGPTQAPANAALLAQCTRMGLSDVVAFAGAVGRAQLPAYLWHADLLVLPSRDEALGVSVIEALCAGLPVIASRTGGIPEILHDERCGLLTEPGDVGDLAHAIDRVLGDKPLRARLAAHAMARGADFDVPAMVQRVGDLYLELLNGQVQPAAEGLR
jgi:glycosyltransferase involved in cell wall biosynthesis